MGHHSVKGSNQPRNPLAPFARETTLSATDHHKQKPGSMEKANVIFAFRHPTRIRVACKLRFKVTRSLLDKSFTSPSSSIADVQPTDGKATNYTSGSGNFSYQQYQLPLLHRHCGT